MAIGVQHGPISAGLAAAQRAGEGDKFKYRFGAERQLVSQGLQARQIDDNRMNQEIQRSMQQQALSQRAVESQRDFALQNVSAGQTDRKLSFAEKQAEAGQQHDRARLGQQQQQLDTSQYKAETARKKSQIINPLDDPRYEALAKLTAPVERRLEKMQEQLARAAGDITGKPAEVERRIAQYMEKPMQIGGSTITPRQLIDAKNGYLAATASARDAARFAEDVASDKAELESKVDEVVDKLSGSLPPNASVDVIKASVIQQLGRPTSVEDLQVIVEAVNEIEQGLRQKQLGRRAYQTIDKELAS